MKCLSRSICIKNKSINKNNNNKVYGPKKKKRSFSIRFSQKKHIIPKRVKNKEEWSFFTKGETPWK